MTKPTKKQRRKEAHLAMARETAAIPARADLEEEIARPGMTGVRQAWSAASAVNGLTPDKLSAILRQADQGDLDALLTLAEEMEERDPHYASVLQTRKLAVLGLERQLVWSPGEEDHPKAAEIHQACSGLINAPIFEGLLLHLLDGIAKPYSVVEILWNTAAVPWEPRDYQWRDPRWFKLDRETGSELLLREPGEVDGVPLPPFRFATYLAGRKSGLIARGGLARLVAFSFVCKLYGLKDWLAYAEIFGIPLRLGKYDATATPADVEVLKRAVFGLGSDAAAVIPQSMLIEFPNLGQAAGGAEIFVTLVNWIDSQVSKAVLGQTMTTDSGSSRSQAEVHDEVRTDLLKADARGLSAIVTRDVIAPFVLFTWGPDAPAPALSLVVEEPEDMAALSAALGVLVPLGLEVDQAEIRKKLKLSEPSAGAKLLIPPKPPAAPAAADAPDAPPVDETPPARARRLMALARATDPLAVARDLRQAIDADLDEAALNGLDGWERTFGGEVAQVMELVAASGDFETLLAGLEAMAGDLAAGAAARSLARSMFEAGALGQAASRKTQV